MRGAFKVGNLDDLNVCLCYDDATFEMKQYNKEDLYLTDTQYAKRNIDIPSKTKIMYAFNQYLELISKDNISHPIIQKEIKIVKSEDNPEIVEENRQEEENQPLDSNKFPSSMILMNNIQSILLIITSNRLVDI